MRKEIGFHKLLMFLALTAVGAFSFLESESLFSIDIAKAQQVSGATTESQEEPLPTCRTVYGNGKVCDTKMTKADLRLRHTDRDGTKFYEYTGSDPRLLGAEIRISDSLTPIGRTRTVMIRTSDESSTLTRRHFYINGKEREYYEKIEKVSPKTKRRESHSYTTSLGADGRTVRVRTFDVHLDGSAWSKTSELGPDGRLDEPHKWTPENETARQEEAHAARNNPGKDNPLLKELQGFEDAFQKYEKDHPLKKYENSNSGVGRKNSATEDENPKDKPDLPKPQQLTGRLGSPKACGNGGLAKANSIDWILGYWVKRDQFSTLVIEFVKEGGAISGYVRDDHLNKGWGPEEHLYKVGEKYVRNLVPGKYPCTGIGEILFRGVYHDSWLSFHPRLNDDGTIGIDPDLAFTRISS